MSLTSFETFEELAARGTFVILAPRRSPAGDEG